MMHWYPWLDELYNKIISKHIKECCHHALLIQAINGIGYEALILRLSKWLMCQQRQGINNCNRCHGCNLMQANTHPDWYKLVPEKNEITLSVNIIREIIKKICNFGKLGGAKIIWLPNIEHLNIFSSNALLKIIEEPPINTWFFLTTNNYNKILPTLRSRCIILYLRPPKEQDGLKWLKKQSIQKNTNDVLLSALRISNLAPISALNLLSISNIEARKKIINTLIIALKKQDVLQLLPILNVQDACMRITWLISLLIDAMKWQQGLLQWISNIDSKNLVKFLSEFFSENILISSIENWMECHEQLLSVISINRELLLVNCLLNWIN